MNKNVITFGFLFAILLMAYPAVVLAQPVLNPGNGHYYELVSPPQGITWTDANTAASLASFQGVPGHLVTFSNLSEWQFVQSTFPQNFTWIGFTDSVTEGTYLWVTGEPVIFTAWLLNEPNNAGTGPGEDYAWYEQRSGVWGWNDYRDVAIADTGPLQFPISYVIEYSAVPEPASLFLLGSSLVMIAAYRYYSRRKLLRQLG